MLFLIAQTIVNALGKEKEINSEYLTTQLVDEISLASARGGKALGEKQWQCESNRTLLRATER